MFDTEKLRDEAVLEMFCQHIHESGVTARPEACGDWESFRDRITAAAHDSVGFVGVDYHPTLLTSSTDAATRD